MGKGAPIFYGWWMVLACLLLQSLGTGTSMYLYSIFAGEWEQAFNTGRGVIMMGLTGMTIVTALIAPKLGEAMDRFSVKRILFVSALMMGMGFFLVSFSIVVWNVLAVYVLFIAIGYAALGMLASPVLLSRWFVRHRGMAIGLAALGSQFGGFTIPPFIAMIIEAADWRVGMRVVGVFVALAGSALTYFVIYDRPGDRGLRPDGIREDPPASAAPEFDKRAKKVAAEASLALVFRDRNFWLSAYSLAVMTGIMVMALANLALFASDIGASREQAALLVSIYAASGMVASPLVGRFCDLLDIRLIFVAMLLCSIASLSLYLVADSYFLLALATVLIAVPGGATMPFVGALVGKLFDIRLYARVFGSISLFTMGSAALVPILSGWVFDITGSYQILFVALIVMLIAGLALTPMIRNKPLVLAAA